MMEVKHSPSSQMDFRTTRNGLPAEEEDVEMDKLLDGGVLKSSLPPTSNLDSDSKQIMNGNAKHPLLEDGMEIDLLDDEMDDDLNDSVTDIENKIENKETENKIDSFELELELQEAAEKDEKVLNGEARDSSNIRDAGDDLDTLLSKINDLVEDCMEPSTTVGSIDDATKEAVNDIVNLSDDEDEEASHGKAVDKEDEILNEAEEKSSVESMIAEKEVESNVETEASADVEDEKTVEAEDDDTDEFLEAKSPVDISEDIPEENGLELTEEDIEMAEEGNFEEAAEETLEIGEEEILETGGEEVSEDAVEEIPDVSEEVIPDDATEEIEDNAAEEIPEVAEKITEIDAEEISEVDAVEIPEEVAEENIVKAASEPAELRNEVASESAEAALESTEPPLESVEASSEPAEAALELAETELESTEIALESVEENISKETPDVAATEIVKETAIESEPETEEETRKDISKETEKVSEEAVSESEVMDIDDEIVCLDSPMPEENEAEKQVVNEESSEKASQPQEENVDVETLQEKVMGKEVTEVKSAEIEAKADTTGLVEDDDEIFLIEDDDDEDELMKKADKTEVSEKPLAEENKIPQEEAKEDSKPEEKKSEENSKPTEKEQKTDLLSEEKPSETKEEEDDDIVCLDDSLEEVKKAKESTDKTVEDKHEREAEKNLQNQTEASTEPIAEKVLVDLSVENSQADKDVPKEVSTEGEVTQKAAEKDVEMETENLVPEKVDAETTIVDEANKTDSEKTVEPPVKAVVLSEVIIKEAPKQIQDTETTESKETQQAAPVTDKSSKVVIDNDIITLDDDDEDEVPSPTEQKEEQSPEKVSTDKSLALLSDNSDNARDGVEEKDDKADQQISEEKSTPAPLESNSNSSSNLLKESTVTEREESRSEPSEQPPAKRIRLSLDEEASSRTSNASQEDTSSKLLDDDEIMLVKDDEDNKSLKRVHSSDSISSDFKKPKTDVESTKVEDEKPELLKEIIPTKVELLKEEEKDEKKSGEVKPLPLYPPPKLDAPKICLSLDFLRRFKKSIHKMNKSDLEELVLQKIVEAIVHKSEFSEMREMIEKQEKIITGHRTKITELNKQFRDLEMVHNRVLKDLETKNSQFIMPVKITRAVGLQVFFPNKKFDQPMANLPAPSPAQTSSPVSRSVSTSSSTNSISEKSAVSCPPTINHPVPQAPVSIPTANPTQQRRGCVQKLTPMRPDGPRAAIPNRNVTAGVVSSSTPSMTSKDASPKLVTRQMLPKSRLSQSPGNVNASINLPQQAMNTHTVATPPELERPKPTSVPGIASKKTGAGPKTFAQSKRIPKSWQSDQQTPVQPAPTPAPVHSSPTVSQSSMANKPPNKSVIDLTDEDDVPAPSPRAVPQVAQKAANNGPMHRVGPYKVSVIPASQLQQQQQPRPNPPRQNPPRPTNAPQMAPKPNGTVQNSVRQTSALAQQRYHHPAPLPNQPIHSSNPLWKLPPARPTIRISNLDSGIVISWTIEDTAKEKYADSTSYQIYAYQETSGPPLVESWRHVGDVKAMLLPMAVTLTQFQEGQRYYFAVRAVDAHNRCGPFSFAKTWS